MQRGGRASGCGCFANPAVSSAGLDLVRTSLVFGLFSVGAAWLRLPYKWAPRLFILLVACFALTWLVETPDSGEAPSPVPELPTREEGPVLQGPPALLRPKSAGPPPVAEHSPDIETVPVFIRSDHDDNPVGGARVSLADADGLPAIVVTSDADGACALPLALLAERLAVSVKAPSPFRSTLVKLDGLPDEALVIRLSRGSDLQLRTIDMDGQIIPHVPLTVKLADGSSYADAEREAFETTRVKSDGRGFVSVPNLREGRQYRVHASGWGRPLHDATDALVPGSGEVHDVRLGPRRIVWARAVDSNSGVTIPTARWRPDPSGDRAPAQDLVVANHHGVMQDLSPDIAPVSGDFFKFFVVRRNAGDSVRLGPLRVVAPGYEATSGRFLDARDDADVRAGPILVRLVPSPDAALGTLTVDLVSAHQDLRTVIRVFRGSQTVFSQLVLANEQSVEAPLPAGDYAVHVGGNMVAEVSIKGGREHRVRAALDTLSSLRISLATHDGMPYEGLGAVALSTAGVRVIFTDVAFKGGRSPRFVLPPQRVAVGVTTVERLSAEPRYVTLVEGKHLEATLVLPEATRK